MMILFSFLQNNFTLLQFKTIVIHNFFFLQVFQQHNALRVEGK